MSFPDCTMLCVLIRYIISQCLYQSIVCQVAGTFQGLPAGDLGDLGKGSLDKKSLESCMELVATHQEIKKIMGEDVESANLRRNSSTVWKPLSGKRRRHLELCARLMSCSQRLYVAEKSWMAMKDPVDHMLRSIQFDDNPGSQLSESPHVAPIPLSLSMMAQTPFVKRILAPLWNIVTQTQPTQPLTPSMSSSQESKTSLSTVGGTVDQAYIFPILSSVLDQKQENKEGSLSPLLQFICACSEAFPFGECWSTCTSENWYEFRPQDHLRDDTSLIKTSSADDLAVVVYAVGKTLELAGRLGGDDDVQIWALRCLMQLAETSACVASVSHTPLHQLCSVWQSIWHSLLRPTLRYVSLTKTTTPSSRGEMIFSLLEMIVRFGCTDLGCVKAGKRRNFLSSEIHAIWDLPTFSDALTVASPVVFALVRSALCHVGISEEKQTGIDGRIADSLPLTSALEIQNGLGEALQRSNRFKLLCLCLRRFSDEIAREAHKPSNEMLSSLFACCFSIVSGKGPTRMISNAADCTKFAQLRLIDFSVIDMKSTKIELDGFSGTKSNRKETIDAQNAMAVLDKVQGACFLSRVILHSWFSSNGNMPGDFVSPRQIRRMQKFSVEYVSALFTKERQELLSPSESEPTSTEQAMFESPLIGKAFAVRFCLSVALCDDKATNSELVKDVTTKALGVIDDFVRILTSSMETIDEMVTYFEGFVSDMLFLVPRVFSLEHLKPSMGRLKDVCRDLLEGFNFSRTQVDNKESSVERKSGGHSLDESEDEDESGPVSKKLRISASAELPVSNKLETSLTSTALQSLTAASSIASVLVLLEPTTATCSFVYAQLSVLISAGNRESLVDVDGALLALQLISSRFDILMEGVNPEESPLSICLRIISKIREGTHGGDEHFGAGFPELTLALTTSAKAALATSDVAPLTTVLLMSEPKEHRWIKMRPILLVERLVAAIAAYEGCGEEFRDTFNSTFARELMIQSLHSESTQVRLKSAHALGVVLRLLPNQDFIYKKVFTALVEDKVQSKATPVLYTLCEAQKGRDDSSCWKHALTSVRYCLVRLWGTIAGCTSDRSVFQDRLFDCIHFACFNPSHEPLCQIAIQKISYLRGYESAEALISDESERLWGKLLDKRISPGSVPLNFSSSGLLSTITRMGLSCISAWGILESEVETIHKLTEQATTEFVFEAASSVLPICLSQFTLEELTHFEQSNVSSVPADFVSHLDALNAFSDGSDQANRSLKDFVEKHMPTILAYGILEAARNGTTSPAHQLLTFSFGLVSAVADDQHRKDLLYAAIRQLLKIQGRDPSEGLDSHSVLLDLDGLTPNGWPDVASVVREGAVEFLMVCRYWLELAQVDSQKISRWRTMAMIVKIILDDREVTMLINEVALRTMLGLLQSKPLQCCHLSIVALISEHLDTGVNRIVFSKNSDRVLIFQLVGTLLQVHERCQDGILDSINHQREHEGLQKQHSFGILLEGTNAVMGGVWGWDGTAVDISSWILGNLEQCSRCCSLVDENVARATYDLLEKVLKSWIASKYDRAENTYADLTSFIRENDSYGVLSKIDKKFAAQVLFKARVGSSFHLSPSDQLSAAMSRFVFFKQKLSILDGSSSHALDPGSLDLDSRLLLDQTVVLKVVLMQCTTRIAPTVEIYHLTCHLLDIVADKAVSLELRIEASKCIGYIGPGCVGEVAELDLDGITDHESDWLKKVGTGGAPLMTFAISKVLEILVEHMKSEPPLSALASLEACKEIASTQEGVNAVNHMTAGNSKAFMATLHRPVLKKKPNLLTPSDVFVDNAIRISNDDGDSNNWCWNVELWEVTDISYEDWIKRLVSSIIICCYKIRRTPNEVCIRGGSLSFRAFARISAMSSSIAAYLLPRIILDLLLSDAVPAGTEPESYKTVEQSWIGHPQSLATQRVSHSVASLARSLEKCGDTDCKSKASSVLSFTMDLLRRISQKRFLNYNKFPPSLSTVAPSNKDRKRNSKAPRRFGSALDLKPEESVQMLVASGKVASAIYYAETALTESGLGDSISERNSSAGKQTNSTQNSLMPILRDCMFNLQEPDAASAYSLKMASIRFLRSDFRLSEHVYSHISPTEKLQLLSSGRSTGDEKTLEIANCLYSLGSIDALRAYAESVFRQQHLSEDAKASLKETCFKAKLAAMDWTDMPGFASFDTNTGNGIVHGFFESLSGALSSLSNEDRTSFEEYLGICRFQGLLQCSLHYGRESLLTSVLPTVEHFEVLNDLEAIGSDRSSVPSLLARWDKEASEVGVCPHRATSIAQGNFKLVVRETVINILKTIQIPDVDIERYLTKHQLRSLSIGREHGQLEFAEGCLQRLDKRISSSETASRVTHVKIRLEEAKLMESRGYPKPAIQVAKLIALAIDEQLAKPDISCLDEWTELKADNLLSCGIWTRRHRVESAKYVQENYLMPAAGVCHDLWKRRESTPNRRRLASSCLALAQNAATLFGSVYTRISSKEWKAKVSFLDDQRKLARELEAEAKRRGKKEAMKDKQHRTHVKNLISRLEEEKEKLEDELGPYASLALQSFGEALSECDKSSNEHWTSHVFRMVSIWFSTHLLVPEVNDSIDLVVNTIPSSRFVPLTDQLFSRISSEEGQEWDPYQVTLQKLVGLMCEQHPYHCLPKLFALINGGDHSSNEEAHDPKVRAANTVMASLREAADDNQLDLYHAYEAVTEAYHELAMAIPSDKQKARRRRLPISTFIKNDFSSILGNFKCVPCVLTRPPMIVENHDYGSLKTDPPGTELMKEILPEIDIAQSGISLPKIVICKGSKGTLFKQLVKGNDDIRQDAIMQQVFTYTNELMRRRTVYDHRSQSHEKIGKSRSAGKTLKLVTYSVVPLGPQSGIVEWVDNTQPFLDYLQDTGTGTRTRLGAHSRYWQGEWSHQLCWKVMKSVEHAKHEEKREAFDKICRNFSPVFRYFFVEMFGHDLQAWHTAKMAYTRSCAVSSIVGHMLGIGDRHANNVLVDQKTGELVHIDFGIVFEQGRLLPTPETVPFRLTRDIVDGMGPLGTEGTFTAAAEETTQILRDNSDTLLTILSAVVNDPHYEWKKSAAKARARQEEEELAADTVRGNTDRSSGSERDQLVDDPSDNLAAKHTIARIKEKLQGYEEGTSSEQQSVEGQVQLLINYARDPDNLCAIFHGWAPWL